MRVVCIGPTTAAELTCAAVHVLVAEKPTPVHVAAAVAEALQLPRVQALREAAGSRNNKTSEGLTRQPQM